MSQSAVVQLTTAEDATPPAEGYARVQWRASTCKGASARGHHRLLRLRLWGLQHRGHMEVWRCVEKYMITLEFATGAAVALLCRRCCCLM